MHVTPPQLQKHKLRKSTIATKVETRLAVTSGVAIKFVGNISKGLSIAYHRIRPSSRFSLPKKSSPRSKSDSTQKIPRIIWQTNYTDLVTLPVAMTYWWNRALGAEYEYRYVSHEERLDFITTEFPGRISDCYKRLNIGAAQADLWRLLALYKHGGVYIDIDAALVWPLARALPSDADSIFLRYRHGGFNNYFIASAPGSPLLEKLIEEALNRIDSPPTNSVYDITGPGVFTDILSQIPCQTRLPHATCLQGIFTNKYFQYIDKPSGPWFKEQLTTKIVAEKI